MRPAGFPIRLAPRLLRRPQRLHDWVATSGIRLDRDRPTRQTAWPGDPPVDAIEDVMITDRDDDFVRFVVDDVARRRAAEVAFESPT